ncbi:cellulose binding domain-containing protein [Micromonospora sp. WMMD1082]|uniref:cellulose binding domain-containing protein n=1 Tax=Micromonospora sp. WMMD1082 TaxID=3016104 RepID=UPI0024169F86|nr:cellulose binding domain-containing protein [Micromonospora sp. WMMD1082]MDG4797457.1 cellulose binding domain-containing protein [Micromonospora sp. WMMD1082]
MTLSRTQSSHRTGSRRRPARSWRRVATGVAALVLAAAGATVTAGPAHADTAAPGGCLSVAATERSWHTGPDRGGVLREITITNTCATAVTGWTLVFVLPPGHTFQQGWNATWSVDGSTLTATPLPWNRTVGAGGAVHLGYSGTWSGSPQEPDCTVNGEPCGGPPGPGPAPEVTLTSPTDGSNLVSVCTVRLTADARAGSGTLDRVEFYLNDTLVGSDTSAPYEIDVPPGHPAFAGATRHTAFARVVTTAPVATADSPAVSFALVPPPPALMVIACPSRLDVPEGGSTTMAFVTTACAATPGLTLTVTGDTGISVSPTVFPPGNRENRITVSAAPGSAGASARITANVAGSEFGCLSATAVVTVIPSP